MRIQIEDIPAQNIMTKDNVTVIIDSVLYWHAIDPRSVTFTVSNIRKALVERTMTTLRQITGARTVQECVEHRESMAQEVEGILTFGADFRYYYARGI
jgi:regulator of protease activity HflC (stomatin/prohibitin superfamily)